MSVKERLHRVVDELPEQIAVELEHYADYLRGIGERDEWERLSLAALGARYNDEEVVYVAADATERPT